jgi:hypothetical protein
MQTSDLISLVALFVALATLLQSSYFWRRSFRPIVTAMVRSNGGGNEAIAYNLVVQNSGTIPARNVTLHVHDTGMLENALDQASAAERAIFLKCFRSETVIPILQNGTEVSSSFGFTRRTDSFWNYRARFTIKVRYEGWMGKVYLDYQDLIIMDSANFTGTAWRP